MKIVFSPAEGLMNRLSYPSKFGLLGLLALIVFTILIMTLAGQLNTTIERSQNELIATSLARPLLKTVEYTQQHRGVSSMLLSGDTAVTTRRSGLETKVDEASWSRHWPQTSANYRNGARSPVRGTPSSVAD